MRFTTKSVGEQRFSLEYLARMYTSLFGHRFNVGGEDAAERLPTSRQSELEGNET